MEMKIGKLTDEQLLEVVNTHMELMNPDMVLRMLVEVWDSIVTCDTQGALETSSLEEKVILISLEMYKMGFIAGQVLYNESIGGVMEMKEGAAV